MVVGGYLDEDLAKYFTYTWSNQKEAEAEMMKTCES